jgi:methylated-DNA-[protein]-cysteine S-methyltransferase
MSTGTGTNATDTIIVTPLETPLGTARLFGTARGLLLIALPGESRASTESWLRREARDASFVEDPTAQPEARAQLTAYFAGERRAFDLPLDWRGTPFQRAVWAAVRAIPYGQTSTYGAIAATLGRPGAARAVGAANGANPLAPIVPCHRLVGSDGSLRGYGAGLGTKHWLLALERGEVRGTNDEGRTRPDADS